MAQTFQYRADELSDEMKREADEIARRLFGKWDWQGIQQSVEGSPGLCSYINRSVIQKIRPKGTKWLVGERQFTDENGCWIVRDSEIVKSTYYIKSF